MSLVLPAPRGLWTPPKRLRLPPWLARAGNAVRQFASNCGCRCATSECVASGFALRGCCTDEILYYADDVDSAVVGDVIFYAGVCVTVEEFCLDGLDPDDILTLADDDFTIQDDCHGEDCPQCCNTCHSYATGVGEMFCCYSAESYARLTLTPDNPTACCPSLVFDHIPRDFTIVSGIKWRFPGGTCGGPLTITCGGFTYRLNVDIETICNGVDGFLVSIDGSKVVAGVCADGFGTINVTTSANVGGRDGPGTSDCCNIDFHDFINNGGLECFATSQPWHVEVEIFNNNCCFGDDGCTAAGQQDCTTGECEVPPP